MLIQFPKLKYCSDSSCPASIFKSVLVDWKLAREFDMKANENLFNYVDNRHQRPSIFIKQQENIVLGQVFGSFFCNEIKQIKFLSTDFFLLENNMEILSK